MRDRRIIAASKAGAEGMSRAMAKELGSRAVTVNCVAPGFIATDMTDVLTEEQKALMLGQIPLVGWVLQRKSRKLSLSLPVIRVPTSPEKRFT